MEQTKTCRECGGRMTQGYVVDYGDAGTTLLQRWWKGPVQKGWLGSLKVRRKEGHEIQTFRCDRCGLLQSYVPNV